MKRKFFEIIYLIIFNYEVIYNILLPSIYINFNRRVDRWLSEFLPWAESNYNIFGGGDIGLIHAIIMPFILIGCYFFYKDLRPIKPLLFYGLYFIGLLMAFAIFFSFAVYVQIPLMEKFIRFEYFYLQFKEEPLRILLLVMYHIILCSVFSIKYYHYLLKRTNEK